MLHSIHISLQNVQLSLFNIKGFSYNMILFFHLTEYVQTAVIPAGARYIRVEEVRSAENYLALKSSSGFYYLNGHWSIQDTGKYDAAGTKVFYARRNQKDQLRAIGPTNEDLYVQVS